MFVLLENRKQRNFSQSLKKKTERYRKHYKKLILPKQK